MKIEFKKLFSIDLGSAYYTDNQSFSDVLVEPTNSCKKLLKKYRLEFRNSQRGAFLFYEGREKVPPTISPLIEIKQEVTFIFQLKIANPAFSDYTKATDWKGGNVYFFKNNDFNTTGDKVVNADLVNPLVNRPEKFKFSVEEKLTESLVTITNALGGFIKNTIVLKEQTSVDIDLSQYPDGEYSIKHIGTTNELKCYKSNHFDPQVFAYLHITYKHGTWTTSTIPLVFKLKFPVKSLVWKYEIYQWDGKKGTAVIDANKVIVKEKVPVPVITFVPDGPVAFPLLLKSNAPIEFTDAPKLIQLLNDTKPLIDSLPNPTAINIQKSGSDLIALMKITI